MSATTPSSTPMIGGKWLTADAASWREYFLRKTSVAPSDFDSKILAHATNFRSPKIGGNSILLAAVDLGLYQGTAP